MLELPTALESGDPRAEREALSAAIAKELSARPTLLGRYQWTAEETRHAMDLPDAFAARGFETGLEHLSIEHEACLATLAALLVFKDYLSP